MSVGEMRASPAAEARGRPKFAGDPGFHGVLKRRVLEYFERTGLPPRDSPRMYAKTAVLLLWFGASYASLVFAAATWWQGALLSASLALAMAGVGFNIQHDANHGAYSARETFLGALSSHWRSLRRMGLAPLAESRAQRTG